MQRLVFLCWMMLLVVSFTSVGSLVVQSEQIHRLSLIDGPAVDANNDVRQAMTDAQTGLTGYQVSGDRALLQPYFGAHDRTMAALATLQGKLAVGAGDRADSELHRTLGTRQHLAVDKWWANAQLTEQALTRGERADLFQSRALFDHYKAASEATGDYLTAQRDQTRLASRMISTRGVEISIAATVAALLAMLVLGRRVASSISKPLTELSDTMVRQRGGEPGARAREDQGSLEIRSVAGDFNAITDQNLALLRLQARDLDTHQTTLEIARAIRGASDTQQALDVMCAALGKGLFVDRVVAHTIDIQNAVQLGAQWHLPDLAPLEGFSVDLLADLAAVAEDLLITTGFRARDDFLAAEVQSMERGRAFYRQTGARAVIMVPIGLDDRVIGMIYVFMVHEPRAWTMAEANVVQSVAGFVAKAIVEVEHQAHQQEYVERIERLDRQKSDFLATVSHELRTPLTSISGYLEVLMQQETGALTAQQQRMLEVISRNTVRLRSLIEDVLVLSRIEGGVRKADFAEVSIRGLITRVGEELTLLAQGSSVRLEIDAGPQSAIVLGERASLDRAVVNILSNAIKFSRPGGVVTITGSIDLKARLVVLTCQDCGVGIPSHDLADLFTRFFRASNATEQAIPGTGLGLSIAKQIVEEHHGGVLRLTSVEDEGTTVVLELPLYEPLFEPLNDPPFEPLWEPLQTQAT